MKHGAWLGVLVFLVGCVESTVPGLDGGDRPPDSRFEECDAFGGLRPCGQGPGGCTFAPCDPATVESVLGRAAMCRTDGFGSCFEIVAIPPDAGTDAPIYECDGGHFVRECGGPWAPCALPCELSRPPAGGTCSSDGLGSCVVYTDAGPMPRAECDGGFGFVRTCESGPEECSLPCDPSSPPPGATCATDGWGACAEYPVLPDGGPPVDVCDGGFGAVRICSVGPSPCVVACDPSSPPPGAVCSSDLWGACADYPIRPDGGPPADGCDGGTRFVRECGRGPRACAIECDDAIIHPGLSCGVDEHGSCFIDAIDAG